MVRAACNKNAKGVTHGSEGVGRSEVYGRKARRSLVSCARHLLVPTPTFYGSVVWEEVEWLFKP